MPPATSVPVGAGPAGPSSSSSTTGVRPSLGAWITSPIALIPLVVGVILAVVMVEYCSLSILLSNRFWGFTWNPSPNDELAATYAFPLLLLGTWFTAGVALVLATFLSLAFAITLVTILPPAPSRVLSILTNLLAGIPSVVYGIWGYVILAPYFGLTVEPTMQAWLGWLPFFGGTTADLNGGTGLLLAIFILMFMVIPLTTAILRESLASVPAPLIEAGLALGATRWEITRRVRLRVARNGLWGAVFLGFGRAIGESVAVAMVIGDNFQLPRTIYSGSNTVAAVLFGQQDSAFQYTWVLSGLMDMAIALLLVGLAVNYLGHWITSKGESRGAAPGASVAVASAPTAEPR